MMEAGGKGFMVEDPKDLRGALDEAMNLRDPRSSMSASHRAPQEAARVPLAHLIL
jgi:hypothetical protein